jgi:hypothetical protein
VQAHGPPRKASQAATVLLFMARAHSGARLSRAQGLFHQHDVEPALELPAAGFEHPHRVKPTLRCTPIEPALAESPITAISYPTASARAASSASRARPQPWPLASGVQVDRIFGREAVGRPRRTSCSIKAEHAAVLLHDQVGQALGQHVGTACRHLPGTGVDFEGACALQHVVGIDRGDGGHVGVTAVR